MSSPELTRRSLLIGTLGVAAVGALSACSTGSTGGSTAAPAGGSSSAAAAGIDWTKKGPINYVQGKDTSGFVQPTIDEWNKANPDQKVTLIELADKADEQQAKMIENFNTKGSYGYDVLSVDVVWTAQFAANKMIVELPSDMSTDGYIKPAVDACKYFNKLYCFPATSDGAMMYYRKDLLDAVGAQAPKTWDEMVATGKKVQAANPGMIIWGGQFQKYEGLTCNFAEWVNGGGGNFLDDQGKPSVNTAEAVAGAQYMANLFKDGVIAAEESTWQEEPSRTAFQDGKVIFHRQWPYQYSLANKTDGSSKVNGKFAVAPLPGKSGTGVSTLGGHNMAVTATAKNAGTCKAFIQWWNAKEQQKANVIKTSNAPTFEALYTDADLVKQFPYLPVLQASIGNAKARPKAVKYSDVTLAIQDAAYSIVKTPTTDVKAALDTLQTKLTDLTK
ncbi:ABC transporter substrate-binding protein [Propioniciclava tarda]|uniref:ABC transporter substrate-binding protein n=1 Tax=Propioniciclava tarda TaxID=433330 RepID=A0A4Q9KKM5_PROTD|nr:ABC transporter substrate-binding protein [Propioniciclava tarda]TBT95052.1 ABC transporter substrate-binding protein [Propioniciclava tarda]SMO54849.1 multiple sugar transport system substrate-binding protein [Propioniciclava tarda]